MDVKKENNVNTDKQQAVFVFEQDTYELPLPLESKSANSEDNYFVRYGKDNQYPAFLYDLYESTSQFNALINNLHDYILGENMQFAQKYPDGDDLYELYDKCALDRCLYNMFAVQRLRNPMGELVGLAYVDIIKLRLGRENGKAVGYYSNNWSTYTKKYVTIPIDDPDADSDIVIYRTTCKGIYPTPLYSGAIKSIVTLNGVDTYHLDNLKNGFNAPFIINFSNGVPTQEERKKIEKKIQDKWCGPKNAGKFIVSFCDNKDNAATIVKVPEDSFDKKYESLYNNCRENLLMAFRCPSQLVGSTLSANAFNNIEYEQAFQLYNKVVVAPMQREMQMFFDYVTGIPNFVTIEPFKIKFDIE